MMCSKCLACTMKDLWNVNKLYSVLPLENVGIATVIWIWWCFLCVALPYLWWLEFGLQLCASIIISEELEEYDPKKEDINSSVLCMKHMLITRNTGQHVTTQPNKHWQSNMASFMPIDEKPYTEFLQLIQKHYQPHGLLIFNNVW
jgi:hypothetical protein